MVTHKAVRETIKPKAWEQDQVTDCSHLLVFAVWNNYTAERITTPMEGFDPKALDFVGSGYIHYYFNSKLLNIHVGKVP